MDICIHIHIFIYIYMYIYHIISYICIYIYIYIYIYISIWYVFISFQGSSMTSYKIYSDANQISYVCQNSCLILNNIANY